MYDRIASNVRKTWLLIIVFVALVVAIGWFFGEFIGIGWWGLSGAVVFAVLMTWGSYFASDRIALAMSRAQPADPTQHAQLHNIVEGLSIAAGMPKPRVYVVQDDAPNAFATGRNPEHAAIAVTTGLIAKMNRDELEGVIAHELSHVKNRDTLVMTIAVTLVGDIVLLADWMLRAMWWGAGDRDRGGGLGAPLALIGLLLLIVSPIVAQLLQFAISRQREFLADADGVFLTRHPDGLINALKTLQADQTVVRTASRATAHLWIESPIARHAHEGRSRTNRQGAWLNRLFDTHPPLESRIEALRSTSLAGNAAMPPPPP
ncbi:MAG TPA: M48 family metalloprotease [Actinomycetota bacterium]|nr:M48 family metalloprotease [Actinomycetota bacterium]